MLEQVLGLMGLVLLQDELQRLQLGEVAVDVVLFVDHVLEQRAGEFPADHRGAEEDILDAVLYPVDPGHDDPLDRLGHSGFDVVREDLQPPAPDRDDPFVDHRLDDLLDEEGVPLGPAQDKVLDGLRDGVHVHPELHQLQCFAPCEPVQVHHLRPLGNLPGMGVFIPVDQHEKGEDDVRRPGEYVLKELLRKTVDPVEVFQYERDRPAGRDRAEERPRRLKHALLPERFVDKEYLIEAERQERPQVRLVFVECERVRDLVKPLPDIGFRDLRADLEQALHQRRPEVVRRVHLEAGAGALVCRDPRFVGKLDQLSLQPGFADPRFPL